MLSILEDIADLINPVAGLVSGIGITAFVTSLLLIESRLRPLGFLLFTGAIWCFGLYILSAMYCRAETDWSTGEAIPTSRVRQEGPLRRAVSTAFTTVWFLGLLYLTVVLLMKVVG